MSQEVRKLSKNKSPYVETVIADVSSLVPPEWKGKFLRYNGKTGCLVALKAVPKTDEEKKANKEARVKKLQAKSAARKKIKKEISELNKEIRRKSVDEDVSSLRAERDSLVAKLEDLRKTKSV